MVVTRSQSRPLVPGRDTLELDGCTLPPELWDGVLEMVLVAYPRVERSVLWKSEYISQLMGRIRYAGDGVTYASCMRCVRSIEEYKEYDDVTELGRIDMDARVSVSIKNHSYTVEVWTTHPRCIDIRPTTSNPLFRNPYVLLFKDGIVKVWLPDRPTGGPYIDERMARLWRLEDVRHVNAILPYGLRVRKVGGGNERNWLGVMHKGKFKKKRRLRWNGSKTHITFDVRDYIHIPRCRPFSD